MDCSIQQRKRAQLMSSAFWVRHPGKKNELIGDTCSLYTIFVSVCAVPPMRVSVARGALLGAVDDDMQTPLHVAVANGHVEAVERLTALQPCAEMQIIDKYKMLPLHLACEGGDPDVISLLLARGARVANSPMSPNRPTPNSAAGEAAANGPAASSSASASAVPEGRSPVPKRKQLIAMQQSELGGSAVFIAKQHEHHEVVKLLERAASGEDIPFPDGVTDSLRELSASSPSSRATGAA